jgi:hypothetical protein
MSVSITHTVMLWNLKQSSRMHLQLRTHPKSRQTISLKQTCKHIWSTAQFRDFRLIMQWVWTVLWVQSSSACFTLHTSTDENSKWAQSMSQCYVHTNYNSNRIPTIARANSAKQPTLLTIRRGTRKWSCMLQLPVKCRYVSHNTQATHCSKLLSCVVVSVEWS